MATKTTNVGNITMDISGMSEIEVAILQKNRNLMAGTAKVLRAQGLTLIADQVDAIPDKNITMEAQYETSN